MCERVAKTPAVANNFVAGDNLFRDFAVDLSDAAIELNPPTGTRRRTFAMSCCRPEGVTCLSCRRTQQSSQKHHRSGRRYLAELS
jgi:hypothetical protein